MLDPRQAEAIRKAVSAGDAAKVQRVEFGVYLVPSGSREGMTHVVTGTRMDGADLACDCEAGSWGKPCRHAAAVMVRKMEEGAKVRVLGPAPVPATEPATPSHNSQYSQNRPTVTVTRHTGLKR